MPNAFSASGSSAASASGVGKQRYPGQSAIGSPHSATTRDVSFTAIATLFAPGFVHLYSSSTWSGEKTALAVAFAYWCLPQIFFYGLYTILGQVLNAHGRFAGYMWAPALANIVAIAGLVWFQRAGFPTLSLIHI